MFSSLPPAKNSRVRACSPVLMTVRGALLLEIGEWGIRPTEYEELGSVALWRSFLQAPERFMRHF